MVLLRVTFIAGALSNSDPRDLSTNAERRALGSPPQLPPVACTFIQRLEDFFLAMTSV